LAWLILFCYFSDIVISEPDSTVYEFGPFRLEPKEHRLVREGRAYPTHRESVRHVMFTGPTARNPDPQARTDECGLAETVVEENSLDRNISAVRKALGQEEGRTFIETVPRVGYRFAAPVTEIPASLKASLTEERRPDSLPRQEIRFCVTADQVRIAYATIGSGYPLVKVAHCFNHLDFEWESPIWRHWVRDLANEHSIVRYDGRGNGLSEWDVEDISFEASVNDLHTVVNAVGLDKFALLGISQGGAVALAYAVQHPERVTHLILSGAYSRGSVYRDRPEAVEVRRALETLVQLNWGKNNPKFFQMAAEIPGARFIPLPSANHLLLGGEPAWKIFREEVASFVRWKAPCADTA
jgi:hypothetical protein